mmetsp:Transcript_60446/g.136636  ORF Transcript_60446/g.136636 Transcript_60446/m.136636 type:complete len:410 (+) Transcript_60446:434-1663(+)
MEACLGVASNRRRKREKELAAFSVNPLHAASRDGVSVAFEQVGLPRHIQLPGDGIHVEARQSSGFLIERGQTRSLLAHLHDLESRQLPEPPHALGCQVAVARLAPRGSFDGRGRQAHLGTGEGPRQHPAEPLPLQPPFDLNPHRRRGRGCQGPQIRRRLVGPHASCAKRRHVFALKGLVRGPEDGPHAVGPEVTLPGLQESGAFVRAAEVASQGAGILGLGSWIHHDHRPDPPLAQLGREVRGHGLVRPLKGAFHDPSRVDADGHRAQAQVARQLEPPAQGNHRHIRDGGQDQLPSLAAFQRGLRGLGGAVTEPAERFLHVLFAFDCGQDQLHLHVIGAEAGHGRAQRPHPAPPAANQERHGRARRTARGLGPWGFGTLARPEDRGRVHRGHSPAEDSLEGHPPSRVRV